MSQLKSYTVKSKNSENVFVFKYHLNGTLAMFEVLDGILSPEQIIWFFQKGNFPHLEQQITHWQKTLRSHFDISIGEPDLSFDAAWEKFDYKVNRKKAETAFAKMKPANIIRLFLSIDPYKKYLSRSGVAQAHLATFINQERYNDEFHKLK